MHISLASWCLFGNKPLSHCIQFQILSPYLVNLFRWLHHRIWIPESFVLLFLMQHGDFKRRHSKQNRSSKKRLTILPSCWTSSVCWGSWQSILEVLFLKVKGEILVQNTFHNGKVHSTFLKYLKMQIQGKHLYISSFYELYWYYQVSGLVSYLFS